MASEAADTEASRIGLKEFTESAKSAHYCSVDLSGPRRQEFGAVGKNYEGAVTAFKCLPKQVFELRPTARSQLNMPEASTVGVHGHRKLKNIRDSARLVQ